MWCSVPYRNVAGVFHGISHSSFEERRSAALKICQTNEVIDACHTCFNNGAWFFKSKLIFFVASTHLGPFSWTLALSKQSSLRPLSSGLVPPRDGLTHELFDRGLRFLLRKERGLIFLRAASNKSQELFIIDYACSSN